MVTDTEEGHRTVPRRSWRLPTDEPNPRDLPAPEHGAVLGRDGWIGDEEIFELWQQQLWDEALDRDISGTERHAGVMRRREWERDLDPGLAEPPPPDPNRRLERRVDTAKASLTQKQAEVIEMFEAGQSDREIASALGCGYANVRQHRQMAIKKLRAAMPEYHAAMISK